MNRDWRVLITNVVVVLAATGLTLGLFMLGARWISVLGLGPMLGFTWVEGKS